VSAAWAQLASDLAARLDTELPERISGSLGVDPAEFQADLRAAGLSFADPARTEAVDAASLQATAEKLIRRATRRAMVTGAIGGMAGLAGVPPEIAWRLVQLLRLAQQLSVVYGHDPSTDKGRLLVQRALAASFDVQLPDQQSVGLKVSDLPAVLRDAVPTAHQGGSWLARAAVRQTVRSVTRPIARSIPGLGAGPGAWLARRAMQEQAEQIHGVFLRAWEGPRWSGTEIIEAVEVQ